MEPHETAMRLEQLVGPERAPSELTRCRQLGIQLLGPEAWPQRLRAAEPEPQILYLMGQSAVLVRPAVAIVGSRRASPLGRRVAFRMGYELARAGLVVVSGLARGIDRAALEGCVSAGGCGGAVLGNGLPGIYPAHHADLARALLAGGGFVASELPLDALPLPAHFPRRNRIISALTLAVVVVEATHRSGSLITAGWALRQGREVFAVPGPVEGPHHEGCHRLIQDGAGLVTSAADVLLALGRLTGESPSAPPGVEASPDVDAPAS